MTKFLLTSLDGGGKDYPTLGFSAGNGSILDGTLFTPPMTTPPTAEWSVYGGASAETTGINGVKRYAAPAIVPTYTEPTDGYLLTYSTTQNAGTWQSATAAVTPIVAGVIGRETANGVAGLDASGKLIDTRMPATYTKAVANGVASLDATTKVPDAQLPATAFRVSEAPLNALREGVVGNGTTDDSAAWAALMVKAGTAGNRREVYIPPMPSFSKVTSTITVPSNTRVFAEALAETQIKGTGSADTMALGAGQGHRLEHLYLSANGTGNVLAINSAYDVTLRDLLLVQYTASKHCLRHFGTGSFIDITVDKCTFNAPVGATVSPIHLENSGNGLNTTQWRDLRFNGNSTMAAPFVRVINDSGSSNYASNHTFRDINAEICGAGIIWGASVNGFVVDNVAPWDVTTYTDDIFRFYTQPTRTICRNVEVRHSGRRGGSLAAGKYDVNFSTAATDCVAAHMSPMHSPTSAAAILLPNLNSMKIACNGTGGPMFESSAAGSFRLPRPGSVDRPDPAVAGYGAMVYNATTLKPNYSDGTNWRDAAGTIVA